jgi:fucose permease
LLALAAFAALGVADGILGPAWPAIRHGLGQPVGALGELQALASAGFLVSALLAARLRGRLRAGPYLTAGAAGGALALAFLGVSPWWPGLLAAMLAVGVAAAFVDVGFNAQAALEFGPRRTHALHALYGVGITAAPLVVAAALAAGSWRLAYAVAAGADAVVAVGIWRARHRFATAPPERWERIEVRRGGRGAVAVMLAVFFVITGLEAAIGAWAPTLLVDGRGYSRTAAAAWTASFWGAFTLARVALAAAGPRVTAERAVRVGVLVAAVGVALLWANPSGAGTAGLPVAGIGLAGLFPAFVLLTPLRLGPERAASAVGRQLAAATLGVGSVVGLAGLVAQLAGARLVAPYLLGVALVLVALEVTSARYG